ncbi:MAG: hypothetical protein M3Q98_10025 [Actinomycetota bacterium]|nr:hypothetical protein [Actinomycetota bacterium]
MRSPSLTFADLSSPQLSVVTSSLHRRRPVALATRHPLDDRRQSELGTYLAERSQRVDDLTTVMRASADHAAPWLPTDVDLPPELRNDVAVWRAAHGIPNTDRRPTGPQQTDLATREHQTLLDQRVNEHLDRHGATWLGPIAEIVGRRDGHTPVLAERLAGLAQQGHDVGRLLETAGRQGPLPDDLATAALDSRITRLVAEERRAADASRQRKIESQQPRTGPSQRGPGIGF